jgi:hypothetical protein
MWAPYFSGPRIVADLRSDADETALDALSEIRSRTGSMWPRVRQVAAAGADGPAQRASPDDDPESISRRITDASGASGDVARRLLPADVIIEVHCLVGAGGCVGIGGKQVSAVIHLAGQRVAVASTPSSSTSSPQYLVQHHLAHDSEAAKHAG